MPLNIPGRVVVFDYGEVISVSPSPAEREELVRVAGVDPATLLAAYEKYRDPYDHGRMDAREYWASIAAEVGASWTPAEVQQLWTIDFRSWISVDAGTIALIASLAEGGTRLAVLSNAAHDFAGALTQSPVADYFERMFFSAELDLLKPDPEIYLHVASELGIEPAAMVFIDNKSVNTDAAAGLGITVHHFTGSAGLSAFLASLAV